MIQNDTAKLYQLFGGQAGDYQELRRSDQAKLAKQRWPLLAWLDLSALHVSEAPKVQLGETPLASAPSAPLNTSLNAPLSTSLSAPIKAPMMPVAASLSPAARAMAGKPVAPTQPAWLPASPAVPVAQAVPPSAPVDSRQKPPIAGVGTAINTSTISPATTSPATAPYLQQLFDPPARLQALGATTSTVAPVAPASHVAPATSTPVVPAPVHLAPAPAPVMSTPGAQAPSTTFAQSTGSNADVSNNTLVDIFSRIAQPAPSSTNLMQPTGTLWSNLASRL